MEDVVHWEHNLDVSGRVLEGREDICASANATYWHRVDDDNSFNFCLVEDGSADAIIFISIAIIAASVVHIRGFSHACILLLGCMSECLVYLYNLGRVGNAYTIWLGVPSDILLYGIVPLLLLNSAMQVNWLGFKKNVLFITSSLMATAVIATCLLTGINMFIYDFIGYGWSLKWIVVFISVLMSIDTAEVSRIIQLSNGPQFLDDFLKAETLIRSSLSLIVFSIGGNMLPSSNFDMQFWKHVLVYVAGGCTVGLVSAWIMSPFFMLVAGSRFKQIGFVYGMTLIVNYVAEYFGTSGPLSVSALGLYIAATGRFDMNRMASETALEPAYQMLGYILRGLSMFLGGGLVTNFIIRAQNVYNVGYVLPLILVVSIFVLLFALRWISVLLSSAILTQRSTQANVLARAKSLITLSGISGPMSILMMSVIASQADSDPTLRDHSGKILLQGLEIGFGFAFMSSTINLLVLKILLKQSGLLKESKASKIMSSHARTSLNRRTQDIIKNLKADDEEILRGIDWTALDTFARENTMISLAGKSKGISKLWKAACRVCESCFRKRDPSVGAEAMQEEATRMDLEQPLIGSHKPTVVSSIRKIEEINHSDMETPFMSRSNETCNPYLNVDSRVSSCSYLPSQGSPGWSSPTETNRPSDGELQSWWGTTWKYNRTEPVQPTLERTCVQQDAGLLATKRSHILWAIKRYIYAKQQRGLISGKGASILIHACDESLEYSNCPLDIWAQVNRELECFNVQFAAWAYHTSRIIIYSSPELLQKILGPFVKFCTLWIGDYLSKSLLTACEVMITYYNALNFLLKSRLFDAKNDQDILSILRIEVEAEINRVYRNILDRETEAPAHFEAVQTYRAMMAVTVMQIKHIHSMLRAGMLSVSQCSNLVSYIQTRKEWLEYVGPRGNHWQSIGVLFFSLPIFNGLDNDILQTILDNGSLREFGEGDIVWDDSKSIAEYGFCIIVRGLVKCAFENGKERLYGSGTLLGILTALTNSHVQMPGSNIAVAQSSQHNKGVLVFFFPQDVLDEIKSRAAEGEQQFRKMLLKMQRQAALDIHESLKATTMSNIEIKYQSYQTQQREKRREMIALSQIIDENESVDSADDSEDSDELRRTQLIGKKYADLICSKISKKLHYAKCVELNPYEPFIQCSHFVILAGSVQRQSPNAGKKLGRSISMTKISAPYVVPMLTQFETSIHADAKYFLTGHQGALMVVCDVDEETGSTDRQGIDFDDGSFSNVILSGEDDSHDRDVSDASYD